MLKRHAPILIIMIFFASMMTNNLMITFASTFEKTIRVNDKLNDSSQITAFTDSVNVVSMDFDSKLDILINSSQVSTLANNVKPVLEKVPPKKADALLRKFPYPYDAMLAISSDIDFSSVEKFEAYHSFLNTKEQTPYGPGLGLDIGDSAWMFVGNDNTAKIDNKGHTVEYSMSYFQGLNSNQIKDAEKIVHYFKVGWIDSLHTYGDFSREDKKNVFTRNFAEATWKAFNESGIKPEIWINHGSPSNVQNFGAYDAKSSPFFNYQSGDDPKSPYYHTDLIVANGIRYVWNSLGMTQFAYNNPLYPIKLRDGKKVWGFYRYTHDIKNGKIVWRWEAHELPQEITKQRLDQLVKEQKYSIIAQHLGKGTDDFAFTAADIASLQMLKSYQDDGKVLVARTVRLLNYARCQNYVNYAMAEVDGKMYININSIDDPVLGSTIPTLDESRGLTFYVKDPNNTTILINYIPIQERQIQRNIPEKNGKNSIEIKWFQPDYYDYTK